LRNQELLTSRLTRLSTGDSDQLRELCEQVAARDGAIISVQGFARGETNLLLERLY
jgi:RHH-type proline utilization regulon transcriptional repressor/proline dehydrogenase/delta 1-pyrroline-5-carboxylate dehydrogenase